MASNIDDIGGPFERARAAGTPSRQSVVKLLSTIGDYIAPQLTSYLTEPETPYSVRLLGAGGAIGPEGQLVAPPSGKVPATGDPRIPGAQSEAFDLASALVPTGGAAKLGTIGAAAMGAASRIPGFAKTGITATSLRKLPLDEALNIARSEQHILPKKEGGFIGAPYWVRNSQDLAKMRADFDAQVAEGLAGAPWYQKAQAGIKEVAGSDPRRQHLLAQEEALFSAQAPPDPNLGFALTAHNAFEAGVPAEKVRTGAQARAYLAGRETGEIPLGAKTGVYARHLDPTLEDPITGTNDIWHARSFGYATPVKNAEGAITGSKPWDRALTAQQHSFMDAETMLAVDRANQAKLGGRSDWTAGEIQAAPWVARKTQGLMEQFGWPYEKARAEALKSYNEAFQKYTAYGTHEATPGMGVRHLPDVPTAPQAEREAFAAPRTWQGPEGRDVIYNALGMYQRPTLPATGVFQSAAGPLEINPAAAARPMVGFSGKAGTREIDPASRAMMTGGEAFRAYMDAQNMGAFSTPIRGQKAGQSLSLELPSRGPLTLAQIGDLQRVGRDIGLPNLIDYGERSVLTSFGDQPTVAQLGKSIKTRGEELSRIASGTEVGPVMPPQRVKLDTGAIDYEKAFASPEGSGMATRILQQAVRTKEAPAMIAKLDADDALRAKVLERLNLDADLAAKTGQPVRQDIQRAREIFAREGLTGLFRALARGVSLPAAALVPMASALQDQRGE